MPVLENKGKPWTPEEFNTLLSELREKKSFKEVAAAHGRTVNAVKFKAFGYACEQVLEQGKSEKEVAEDLGLLQKELEKEVNRRLPKLVSADEPVVEKKSLVVVKKPQVRTLPDDVAEIWSTVNTLQSLVHKYMNKFSSK
jgi:poly(A) polymerase Pap1